MNLIRLANSDSFAPDTSGISYSNDRGNMFENVGEEHLKGGAPRHTPVSANVGAALDRIIDEKSFGFQLNASQSAGSGVGVSADGSIATGGSKAVLSALRALQDKIRRLETEKSIALEEATRVRQEARQKEVDLERDYEKEKLGLQKVVHETNIAFESLEQQKTALDLRLVRAEDKINELKSEISFLHEKIGKAEERLSEEKEAVQKLERALETEQEEKKKSTAQTKEITQTIVWETKRHEDEKSELIARSRQLYVELTMVTRRSTELENAMKQMAAEKAEHQAHHHHYQRHHHSSHHDDNRHGQGRARSNSLHSRGKAKQGHNSENNSVVSKGSTAKKVVKRRSSVTSTTGAAKSKESAASATKKDTGKKPTTTKAIGVKKKVKKKKGGDDDDVSYVSEGSYYSQLSGQSSIMSKITRGSASSMGSKVSRASRDSRNSQKAKKAHSKERRSSMASHHPQKRGSVTANGSGAPPSYPKGHQPDIVHIGHHEKHHKPAGKGHVPHYMQTTNTVEMQTAGKEHIAPHMRSHADHTSASAHALHNAPVAAHRSAFGHAIESDLGVAHGQVGAAMIHSGTEAPLPQPPSHEPAEKKERVHHGHHYYHHHHHGQHASQETSADGKNLTVHLPSPTPQATTGAPVEGMAGGIAFNQATTMISSQAMPSADSNTIIGSSFLGNSPQQQQQNQQQQQQRILGRGDQFGGYIPVEESLARYDQALQQTGSTLRDFTTNLDTSISLSNTLAAGPGLVPANYVLPGGQGGPHLVGDSFGMENALMPSTTTGGGDLDSVIKSLEDEFLQLNNQYRKLLTTVNKEDGESKEADELVSVINKLHKKGEQLRKLRMGHSPLQENAGSLTAEHLDIDQIQITSKLEESTEILNRSL